MEKIQNKKIQIQIQSLQLKAYNYMGKKQYDQATNLYKKILELLSEDSKKDKACIYKSIGTAYAFSEKWSESKENYLKALTIYKSEEFKKSTKKERSEIYISLQGVCHELKEFKESEKYFGKSSRLNPTGAKNIVKNSNKQLDIGIIKKYFKNKGSSLSKKDLDFIKNYSNELKEFALKKAEADIKTKTENLLIKIKECLGKVNEEAPPLHKAIFYCNIATYYQKIEELKEEKLRTFDSVKDHLKLSETNLLIAEKSESVKKAKHCKEVRTRIKNIKLTIPEILSLSQNLTSIVNFKNNL